MRALHRITFAPLLALLVAAPSVIHAQSPGDRVRVLRPADKRVVLVGSLERESPDSVWLVPDGRAEPVAAPLGGMRLERSLGRRGHALTGLLIGAGAGAAAGIVFWAGFCGGNSDNFCDGDEELRIAAVFIIPPAVLGAGIGALVKSERWEPVLRARPGPGGGIGLGLSFRL